MVYTNSTEQFELPIISNRINNVSGWFQAGFKSACLICLKPSVLASTGKRDRPTDLPTPCKSKLMKDGVLLHSLLVTANIQFPHETETFNNT